MSDRSARSLLAWTALGGVGAVCLIASFWVVFPFLPRPWRTSMNEARAIALERLADLGPAIDGAYVVTALDQDAILERRLEIEADRLGRDAVAASPLARRTAVWEVTVYPPGASSQDWRYRAEVGLDGELNLLRLRLRAEEPASALDATAGRNRSDEFLRAQGVDLADYLEPEIRPTQVRSRTDTSFRYRARQLALGERLPYGIEVVFAGDQLAGFQHYLDDPDVDALRESLRGGFFISFARILVVLIFVGVVAGPFLRRYHAGEVGVRRGVEIFVVLVVCGVLLILLTARSMTQGVGFGVITRAQTTWAWGAQLVLFFFVPMGLLGALTWSVGESMCRERWGTKLAAFDALLSGQWSNATFARSALRGTAAGLLAVGVPLMVTAFLQRYGVWAPASFNIAGFWPGSPWIALTLPLAAVVFAVSGELLGRLFLLPWLSSFLGRTGAIAVSIAIGAVFLWSSTAVWVIPSWVSLLLSSAVASFAVWLFLRYDLFTVVQCSFVGTIALGVTPFLFAEDRGLQLQGGLAMLVGCLPLLLSLRHLGSDKEFVYRYDDVPPHVRRIAERERQRVELETARQIQSSILPELPPQLQGIELAHVYLPATEVGGDFYDVLALEDGRLAVAVGDVAGHGVSSGLVMSMARSALAVQITFDPEVAAVFRTLNRVVFQSARKRLLTTLCYAVVDPRRLEMQYGSAGHLFPYRVSRDGRVDSLESVSYPLGVRNSLDVVPRAARLEAGDTLVMFSDGLVEARRAGSEDVYGFDRLEDALRRHAGRSPGQIRDSLLDELRRFTKDADREDDLTILVLRLPGAPA